MKKLKAQVRLMLLVFLCGFPLHAQAQVSVTTEAYDTSRTASNLNETILNQSNVNASQFGKLFSDPVDGSVYAQPLYVPNLTINNATHNVVYVATMNDVVYAFDADSAGPPLWESDFRVNGAEPVPSPTGNITGNVGIESTPVIDLSSNTIYVVAYTVESGNDVYRLHALDIATGSEKYGGPVVITASAPGTGYGSVNGMLTFTPSLQNQRAALALVNGMVFIAWASFGDVGSYHGWIMAYSEQTLAQVSAVCTTPNGMEGGVWMSGRGPVVDSSGNIYYMTGNGDYDSVNDFGDSFVRYSTSTNGFSLADWFTPDDFAQLAADDEDLGSSGPLLIPGSSLIIGGGKDGNLYLVNTTNMGHEWAGNSQIAQWFNLGAGSIFSGPAFYNRTSGAGPWLYIWPNNNAYLTAYHFNGSTLDLTPVSQSIIQGTSTYGSGLAVTANGNTPGTGIVWASQNVSPGSFGEGTAVGELHAFSADNLANELWNSNMNSARDNIGTWAKWRSPLVVNGNLYMANFTNGSTGASLSVYGLLPTAVPPSTSSTVNFLATDTTTLGNWQGIYGADGYDLAQSAESMPAYASATVQNNYNWTWASSTADTRGLGLPSGGRIAACWYAPSAFEISLGVSNGPHQVSLYLVDWDHQYRSEIVKVEDTATGIVEDTENVTSFTSGVYLSWNISGNVTIVVTATGGPNSVVSGIFFGGAGTALGTGSENGGSSGTSSAGGTNGTPASTPTAAAVKFVAADVTTLGSWPNKYGTDGYDLVGLPSSQNKTPAYASFSPVGYNTWTWSFPSTDPRALLQPGSTSGIAAAWYNLTFAFSLSFNDGNTHQFAIYLIDWDGRGRAETIQIADANSGAILDTRTISNFVNGEYLVWDISGSVVLTVTATAGPNAVVSGAFFDPPPALITTPPATAPTWLPQIVLNWTTVPGATSYNIYRGLVSGGPYTVIASQNSTTYTDTSVVTGTVYFYVITGVNSIGEGPKSTELSDTAPGP